MPLYEYQCNECGRRTEKIQKFSDPELTVCPYCGGKLERTLTAPAVQFKGGGWYKDLYSSAKPAASTGSTEGAKPSDAGSSSKPAESTTSPASSNSSSATANSSPTAPSAPATSTKS